MAKNKQKKSVPKKDLKIGLKMTKNDLKIKISLSNQNIRKNKK